MATGAARRLAIIAEATYGAGAGAAPAWDTALVRSGGPKLDTDTLEDDSIRADFQRQGVRLGSRKGSFAVSTWARYGAYDAWLEALLGGTWANNVLATGLTRHSFAMEEYFEDLGSADKPYHRWDGCEFSKLSMQVQNNQLVSANFEGLCRNLTGRYDAAITSATYATPSTNPPFAFKDATFTIGGTASGIITSWSLAIDRQLQPRYTANSAVSLRPDSKTVKVNGSVEIWLDVGAGTLIDAFLAETQKALGLSLVDPLGNTLALAVPALRFTSGMPNVSGDGSIPVALAFEAYYDSVSASQLTVTRTAHV
jgi:hypothetical protein